MTEKQNRAPNKKDVQLEKAISPVKQEDPTVTVSTTDPVPNGIF